MGDRIKERRTALGLTLNEVAERLDTIAQTIHKYETGTVTNMPLEKLEKLADILETTPMYLMGWSENKKPAQTMDELDREALDAFMQLSPDRKRLLIAQIKAAKSY
jgi:transcriptional regulator with XRE-family HTH domain